MKSFKCERCLNKQVCYIEGKRYIYCPILKRYPSPRFIEAWGCDNFKDSQLNLFGEEEDNAEKTDNNDDNIAIDSD